MAHHRFRVQILIAFCLVALGLSSLFQASADPLAQASPADTTQVDRAAAQAQFEQLWRPAIDQATRSRDPQARITLAEQMLEAARQMPDSPGVQRLTLEQAMELAAVRADGVGVSFAAADMLAELYPEEAANLRDARIELTQGLVSRTRDPAQRTELAGLLVQLLMQQGQELLEAEEFDQARQSFQRAANFNRVARSVEDSELASLIRLVDDERRLVARIAQLQQQIESDTDDKAGVTELAMLLLAEREDVEAAAKLVDRLDPGPLKSVLTILGMEDHDGVTDQQWLETGWQLVTLAESRGLTPPGQATLLTLAKEAYQEFLKLYERQDALAIQVAQSITQIDARLEALDQLARQGMQLRRRAPARFPMAEAIGFGQSRKPMSEENAEAVRRGVAFLLNSVNPLGHWDDGAEMSHAASQTTGRTAIAVYALLRAGESPVTNQKLATAIRHLEQVESQGVYAIIYRALVWERLGPRYRPRLQAELLKLANAVDPNSGLVGYRAERRNYTSEGISHVINGHFAIVGAIEHRIRLDPVPLQSFVTVLHHQTPDVIPWAYRVHRSPGNTTQNQPLTSTMNGMLFMRVALPHLPPDQRRLVQQTSVKAWRWLEDQFQSPNLIELSRHGNSLYAIGLFQRLCKVDRRSRVKDVDWYDALSTLIRRSQNHQGQFGGSGGVRGTEPISNTALAIIFLTGGGVD